MNKIVSIVGPTATGKTSLAFKIASHLLESKIITGVNLISADSRQIYKGLEIVSGADMPQDFFLLQTAPNTTLSTKNNYSVWTSPNQTILLHGVSIIEPDQEWSLAHFQEFAQKIIKKSWQNNQLSIIVGGTGLYHQHLFDSSVEIKIKPDLKIRQKAEKMTLTELQNWLKKLNSPKFSQMNNSDKNNPRRLVRAIEISSTKQNRNQDQPQPKKQNQFLKTNVFTIGLTNSLESLEQKIKVRVNMRFENGAIEEIKKLYKNYPELNNSLQNSPVTTTTGVKEIWQFLNNQINREECLKKWSLREFQYAKKQLTWWKKRNDITWLNSNSRKEIIIKKVGEKVG